MTSRLASVQTLASLALLLAACASGERRFPLRNPLWRDADLDPVRARCRAEPKPEDPHHVACAPEPYDAPIYWDGADNLLFRPLSETLGIVATGESVNVNSVDEVPDSAWFSNRLGVRPVSLEELRLNACTKGQLLDPDHASDGSWVIDKGKTSGSTPGFRINLPGKGKYLIKVEATGLPERQVAATVIGEAVFYATGYYASCEQALFVRPSIFKLKPGLIYRKGNFGDELPFDQEAFDSLLARSNKRNGLLRISASAWVPGYGLGQFRYEGTRATTRTTSFHTRTDVSCAAHGSSPRGSITSTRVRATPSTPGCRMRRAHRRIRPRVTSSTFRLARVRRLGRSGRGRRSRGASATRTSLTGATWQRTSSRWVPYPASGTRCTRRPGKRRSGTSTLTTSIQNGGRTSTRIWRSVA